MNHRNNLSKVIAIGIASLLLAGCDRNAPDCDSEDVTKLAIKIARESESGARLAFGLQGVEANWDTLRLDTIRLQSVNEATGARQCAARYLVDVTSKTETYVSARPIIYSVEKTSKAGEIYVTLQVTGGLDRASDATPLTIASQQKSSSGKVNWKKFAGRQPSELLQEKAARAILEPRAQQMYELLVTSVENQGEIEIIDDRYLTGRGCSTPACGAGGYFVVDVMTDEFFASFYLDKENVIAGEDFKAPDSVREHYAQWIKSFSN